MLNDFIKNALKTKKSFFSCIAISMMFPTLNKIVEQGISQQIHFDATLLNLLDSYSNMRNILLHDFI